MKYSFATLTFALLLSCFAILQILFGQVAAAYQLSAPQVGVVRYANGDVYLLYGLPGSYVTGPRMLESVNSISFSKAGGLVARKGSLALFRPDLSEIGSFETAENGPVLGLDGDLTTAIAWLPSTQKLVHWNGQAFVPVSVPDLLEKGSISFVSKRDSKTAVLLLYSPNSLVSEVSVSLETGQVTSATTVTGAHGPSVRYGSFVLFADGHDLVVTTPSNGNTQKLPFVAGDLKVEQASSDCFHLQSSGAPRDWLLHFRNGSFELGELPAPSAVETAK